MRYYYFFFFLAVFFFVETGAFLTAFFDVFFEADAPAVFDFFPPKMLSQFDAY